jgi:NADH-quinone oxidoreductase subunit B
MSSMEGSGFLLTKVEDLINWGRKNSTWYLLFGTACCAIELMQTGGPRGDLERFGSAPRASPRQADLIIVAGTITYKMATRVRVLYDQMAEPKYVISMGSCSNCGGLFQPAYSVLKGIDQVVPVDVYVPGCPPRPEALIEGLLAIQKKMETERGWIKDRKWRQGRQNVIAPPAAEAETEA